MKFRLPRKKKKEIKKAFGVGAYDLIFINQIQYHDNMMHMLNEYCKNYKGIFEEYEVRELGIKAIKYNIAKMEESGIKKMMNIKGLKFFI